MYGSLTPAVIADESEYLVITKPAGLLVHPGPHTVSDEPTVTRWLLKTFPEVGFDCVGDVPEVRPGIVHRLDKPTSGVMVIAKTQASFELFKKMFQERAITKEYRCLVHGVMKNDSGVIDRPIGIIKRSVRRSVFSKQMRKEAVTEYEVIERFADTTYLKVFPKTGRTHQLRVHFASLGHPILGDTLYIRKKREPTAERLMLHAHSIAFVFNERPASYSSPLPDSFLVMRSLLSDSG